jgi:Tfp pilus assembly protein PilN
MRARTNTVLGIDIGAQHVSLALVEKDGYDLRVLAAATERELSETPGQQPPDYAGMFARALAQVGRRGRPWRLRAAVAFSTMPTVIQLLDLPRHVPTNVGRFVEQELRQYVALSGREMLSDFCGVGAGPDLPKRLLAVGTHAGAVRETVRAGRAAGVSVEAVEPAVLACARLLLRDGEWTGGGGDLLLGVLDAGCLTICLLRKGMLDFVRVREMPPEARTAEQLGKRLAEELRAVLTYYEAEGAGHRGWSIRVVVHDAGCPAEAIQRCLAAEAQMGQATVSDACDDRCLPHGANSAPGAAAQGGGVSLAAFGAAARLLDEDPRDWRVNLLPEEVTRARTTARHLLVAANVAAWVFLGLVVLIQVIGRTTGVKRAQIERTRISRQLYTTPALIAQDRFVEEEIARVRQELQRWEVIRTRQRVPWPRVLQAARQAVPAEVSLTQMVCSDSRNLSLKGLAPSCEAAQQFVRNLDDPGLFAAVALNRMERRQDNADLIEYQIECSLKAVR